MLTASEQKVSILFTLKSLWHAGSCWDTAGVTDIRWIFRTCEVYSLASLKFLFSIFTHCLGSALFMPICLLFSILLMLSVTVVEPIQSLVQK